MKANSTSIQAFFYRPFSPYNALYAVIVKHNSVKDCSVKDCSVKDSSLKHRYLRHSYLSRDAALRRNPHLNTQPLSSVLMDLSTTAIATHVNQHN
ncbi:MAG: hypothetical protein ACRCVV_05490 [Shewanella sp.]